VESIKGKKILNLCKISFSANPSFLLGAQKGGQALSPLRTAFEQS